MKSKKVIFIVLGVFFSLVLLCGACSFVFLKFSKDSDNGKSGIFDTVVTKRNKGIPDDLDMDNFYSISDLNFLYLNREVFWAFGLYEGESLKNESFNLREEDSYLYVDVSKMNDSFGIENGDYVLVKGEYVTETFPYTLFAEAIYILEKADIDDLFSQMYASVEMKILENDLNYTHGCENAHFTLEIKNTGKIPIDYLKTGSNSLKYAFMLLIDDEIYSLYPDSDFDDVDNVPVGYLYGLRNFSVLNPGETKEVRFGLGGRVQDTYDSFLDRKSGTSGSPNAFCNNAPNEERNANIFVKFGNVRKRDLNAGWIGSEYEFVNVAESNKISVRVANCKCDLSVESFPESL